VLRNATPSKGEVREAEELEHLWKRKGGSGISITARMGKKIQQRRGILRPSRKKGRSVKENEAASHQNKKKDAKRARGGK